MALAPSLQISPRCQQAKNLVERIAAVKERKRFRRFKIALDADYLKARGFTSISSLTTTKDISLGGLYARLNSLIRKGDKLLIELTSPANRILVKVVWGKIK